MLPTSASALALPWTISTPTGPINASVHDVTTDYARVMRMPVGLAARAYRAPTSVELLEADIEAIAVRRLDTEFLPALRELCPGFDGFRRTAQSALVDLVWNLGPGAASTPARHATGLRAFPTLLRYVNAGRWADAALECHRSTARAERNDWTRARFLAAAVPVVA
jgi:hypothetical protein